MEPSHKDAETAAAADPRGASSSSGVVVQVREKKGPLRAAIPYMPFPVAVICLFLNTFVPGLGERRRGAAAGGRLGASGPARPTAPAPGRWQSAARCGTGGGVCGRGAQKLGGRGPGELPSGRP